MATVDKNIWFPFYTFCNVKIDKVIDHIEYLCMAVTRFGLKDLLDLYNIFLLKSWGILKLW